MSRTRPLPAQGETSQEAILASYPARAGLDWDLIDGQAVLGIPKHFGWIERALVRWLPGPEVAFVRLDRLGTQAWVLCDGTRSGREIALALREVFKEDAEPAEERAARFIAHLVTRGYARAFNAPRPVVDDPRGFLPERGFQRVTCGKCHQAHPIKAPPGARYVCPRCRKIARVPRAVDQS